MPFRSASDEKRELAQQEEESTPRPGGRAEQVYQDPGMDHVLETTEDIDEELPPYSPPQIMSLEREGVQTSASVTHEGRVNINIDQKSNRLSGIFGPALASQLQLARVATSSAPPPEYAIEDPTPAELQNVPRLNLLIQVVGSRGDVQPFIALGKVLKERHGHRVRLATHPVFKDFVEQHGLEFFSLSGDPSELMAFMVKNPGLIPGYEAIRSGDVTKRRKEIYKILVAGWRSAVEPGDGMADGPVETASPFVADAIIANPPSFSHIHVAEALNIPLHMMFTMPWSPTQSFPHPLANIQSSNTEANVTNFMSYLLIELFTWQGLGSLINRFREKTLGLEPVSSVWGPVMLAKQRVPFTYCWSPALMPKPADWRPHIKLSGFYLLQQASSYTPPEDLAAFLEAGSPPVYIGFGSIVVDDPNALTRKVFEAIRIAGCRALVSRGWGKMGDGIEVPDGTFMLGNCPHDWLFPRVSAVVHHGGAGTTAAGIANGKPTVIVPFFGDQPFWGSMVYRAGAGPEPIPHKQLTAEKLGEAIKQALLPATQAKAQELCERMKEENGTQTGADSFHSSLPLKAMKCSVSDRRAASFRYRKTNILLSPLAVVILVSQALVKWDDLKRIKSKSWLTDVGSVDPVTGATAAIVGSFFGSLAGFGELPKEMYKLHKDGKNGSDPSGKGKGRAKQKDSIDSTHSSEQSSLKSLVQASAHSVGARSPLLNPQSSDSHQRTKSVPRKPVASSSKSITSIESDETKASDTSNKSDHSAARSAVVKGALGPITPLLRAPVDFSYNIAQGFRNAPLMWGDDTVRPQRKITNLQSGLAVAGKEFGYGFYDGIAGIFTQPVKGAMKEGPVGFAKGFGKGLGGALFKPGAAIWGVPGYAFKGIWREIEQLSRVNTKQSLRSARIAQGMEELQSVGEEEAVDICRRFREALEEDIRNKKAWYHVSSKPKPKEKGKETPLPTPSVPSSYYSNSNLHQSSSPALRPRSSNSSSSGSFFEHQSGSMTSSSMMQPSPRPSQISLRSSNTDPSHESLYVAASPTRSLRSSSLTPGLIAAEASPKFTTELPEPIPGAVELSAHPSLRELPGSYPTPHDVAALAGAGRPLTIVDRGVSNLPNEYLPSPSEEMLHSIQEPGNGVSRKLNSKTNNRISTEIRTSVYEEPVNSSESEREFSQGDEAEGSNKISHSNEPDKPLSCNDQVLNPSKGDLNARSRSAQALVSSRISTSLPIPLASEPSLIVGQPHSPVSPISSDAHCVQPGSISAVTTGNSQAANPLHSAVALPTTIGDFLEQNYTATETQPRQQIQSNEHQAIQARESVDEEEQMRLALEASLAEFQSQAARDRQEDMEDAMVLEYVKKASLAEERFLRGLRGGASSEGSSGL